MVQNQYKNVLHLPYNELAETEIKKIIPFTISINKE